MVFQERRRTVNLLESILAAGRGETNMRRVRREDFSGLDNRNHVTVYDSVSLFYTEPEKLDPPRPPQPPQGIAITSKDSAKPPAARGASHAPIPDPAVSTPAAPAIAVNAKESPPPDPSTPTKPPATYHPPADDDNLTTVWFSPAGEIAEVIPAPSHQKHPQTKPWGWS